MAVVLTPKTGKGKNKLHEAGNPAHWIVVETREMVGFSDREGPWLFVRPDNNMHDKSRWVHATSDVDFVVVNKGN